MSKEKETRLKGPWKGIQTAIWLIGLAILAWQNWWWPGILVLIAVSALTQAAIQGLVPGAVEEVEEEGEKSLASEPTQPKTTPSVVAQHLHPIERLPSECPKCSAPIRGIEVRWTGIQSADCPYCGANLPLKPI